MFGEEILNGKQIIKKLNISPAFFYRLLDDGLPFHRLGRSSRRYYVYSEVKQWILEKEMELR